MTRSVRTSRVAALTAALALTFTLAACGTEEADPADTPSAEPTSSAPTSEEPAPTTTEPAPTTEDDDTMITSGPPADGALPTGPVDPSVEQRDDVQAAIAAEAERRSVEPDAVHIAGYSDITWRNGALGCPGEGQMYTQALVPGHILVLEVDGQLASYHAAKDKPFKYCANPQLPPRDTTDS